MPGKHDPSESDVDRDQNEALSRATGGVDDPDAADQGSTTGPSTSGVFVGRVSGEDVGYEGETGAERRAAAAGQADPGPG